MEYRIEHDSMGEMKVPADRLWAAQTQRSHENFEIGVGIETMPAEIIHAFGILKKAAALANHQLKPEKMTDEKTDVITRACDEVISGELNGHFPLVVWQTGSGTQSNMNANEVIANRAIELLGGTKGDYSLVNPNDHVNCGQSTNDVYPSCGKMTLYTLTENLLDALHRLALAMDDKAAAFDAWSKWAGLSCRTPFRSGWGRNSPPMPPYCAGNMPAGLCPEGNAVPESGRNGHRYGHERRPRVRPFRGFHPFRNDGHSLCAKP